MQECKQNIWQQLFFTLTCYSFLQSSYKEVIPMYTNAFFFENKNYSQSTPIESISTNLIGILVPLPYKSQPKMHVFLLEVQKIKWVSQAIEYKDNFSIL